MDINHLLNNHLTRKAAQQEIDRFAVLLSQKALWSFHVINGFMLFQPTERGVGLLWSTSPQQSTSLAAARELMKGQKPIVGGGTWRLPTTKELLAFAKLKINPLRRGSHNRLHEQYAVFSSTTRCDLDYDDLEECGKSRDGSGYSYKVADFDLTLEDAQNFFLNKVQRIMPSGTAQAEDILPSYKVALAPCNLLRLLDKRAMPLPPLDMAEFTDPNKGLWEAWGMDEAELQSLDIIPRNPVRDIQERNVAIDFGTSSTVVAYADEGRKKLLRVGLTDYGLPPEPAHFENPTVLEFIDLPAFLDAWNERAYRPEVDWDHVHTSHEALHSFRNNESDAATVASILPKIKQWALRQSEDNPVKLTDRTLNENGRRTEWQFEPLKLRTSVKGKPLAVSKDDPLDPVELYAWFLGMIINWRKSGIHLRYYMTFPVEYPREVKDKILSSFKLGLQRSMPEPLIGTPEFEDFEVVERASEPAAYAACALKELNIAPSKEGVAYGVFDFGGGTTDFDFGYYRLPNDEELSENDDVEEVFEHFGAAGDKFLGGENLLEHMAYQVFQANMALCAKNGIVFSRPMDASDFPGSEMLIDHSQAATTNSLMLMSRLRPLWEGGEFDNGTGVLKINLLSRNGATIACELLLDDEALCQYLMQRIGQGVRSFCVAMRKAFGAAAPKQVHVLLAGNASRSRWVLAHFGKYAEDDGLNAELSDLTESWLEELFAGKPPDIVACEPLPVQPDNPYAPTAKTGVALGLLDLCPGSPVWVVNSSAPGSVSEAPFAHYVGRIRNQVFAVGLHQGAPYQQWAELGAQREKVFELRHTTSPQAYTGTMPKDAQGLRSKRLNFSGAIDGHKVYARAIGPSTIEICTAASLEDANANVLGNLRELVLTH